MVVLVEYLFMVVLVKVLSLGMWVASVVFMLLVVSAIQCIVFSLG